MRLHTAAASAQGSPQQPSVLPQQSAVPAAAAAVPAGHSKRCSLESPQWQPLAGAGRTPLAVAARSTGCSPPPPLGLPPPALRGRRPARIVRQLPGSAQPPPLAERQPAERSMRCSHAAAAAAALAVPRGLAEQLGAVRTARTPPRLLPAPWQPPGRRRPSAGHIPARRTRGQQQPPGGRTDAAVRTERAPLAGCTDHTGWLPERPQGWRLEQPQASLTAARSEHKPAVRTLLAAARTRPAAVHTREPSPLPLPHPLPPAHTRHAADPIRNARLQGRRQQGRRRPSARRPSQPFAELAFAWPAAPSSAVHVAFPACAFDVVAPAAADVVAASAAGACVAFAWDGCRARPWVPCAAPWAHARPSRPPWDRDPPSPQVPCPLVRVPSCPFPWVPWLRSRHAHPCPYGGLGQTPSCSSARGLPWVHTHHAHPSPSPCPRRARQTPFARTLRCSPASRGC
mmetsp:Transcript_30468/g.58639  ORF Transcript_30468/g.58639 Transcript_30468/m.58639 type:complete len:456 (-) Transcript_30468:1430-2797(-)